MPDIKRYVPLKKSGGNVINKIASDDFVWTNGTQNIFKIDDSAQLITLGDNTDTREIDVYVHGAMTVNPNLLDGYDFQVNGTTTAAMVYVDTLNELIYLGGLASTAINSVKDEDNMASDSATALATQQSIKAYVDANQSSPGIVDATVGSGGTYADVQAAIDAGVYRVRIIANVTEDSTVTPGANDLFVWIDSGVTWAMSTNVFSITTGSNVSIMSDGGGTLSYAGASTTTMLTTADTSYLYINGVILDNSASSSNGARMILCSGEGLISNVIFKCCGYSTANLNINDQRARFIDSEIVGAVGVSQALEMNSGSYAGNILLSGSWGASPTMITLGSVSDVLNGLKLDTAISYTGTATITARGNISDVHAETPIKFDIAGERTMLTNINLDKDDATSEIDFNNNTECEVTNFQCRTFTAIGNDCHISNGNTVTAVTISSNNCTVDNIRTQGVITLSGSGNKVTGITIDTANTNFAVTGDNNVIMGNFIGIIGTGGGTGTIDFAAGADNNIAVGNQLDSAITDAGSGNSYSVNVIF